MNYIEGNFARFRLNFGGLGGQVREFEFNEGSFIDISLGQAVIKDISRSCGDECSYPTTIAHFCIAPVVQTCGEGASVSAADCAAARNLCLQR